MGVMDILLKVAKVISTCASSRCDNFQLRLEMSFALSEAAGRESSEAEESTSSELLEMTTSLRFTSPRSYSCSSSPCRRNVREMEDVHLLPQSYREVRAGPTTGFRGADQVVAAETEHVPGGAGRDDACSRLLADVHSDDVQRRALHFRLPRDWIGTRSLRPSLQAQQGIVPPLISLLLLTHMQDASKTLQRACCS